MGKKKMAVLGTENEEVAKAKATVKREQKKLRKGEVKTESPVVEATPVPAEEVKKSAKTVHHRSKAYKALKSQIDAAQVYDLAKALKLLREVSQVKFDPSVELHLVLKEKGASREVEMPHSTGKVRRIAIADEETIAKIEKNMIDFDVLLASADQMPKLVKFAKVLGPRGLMPNPKNGTVVPDPAKTAKTMATKVTINLKTEKDAPLIHTMVGKLSMSDKDLSDNISAITEAMSGKMTKVVLKSTMSPAIKLQLN